MTRHAGRRQDHILVIKHGALGDFILAIGPFQAIRAHHPGAQITLLTSSPFAALAEASGCFDAIWIDDRPPAWRLDRLAVLWHRLARAGFSRVYDLQTSRRSSFYRRLSGWPKPEWSGIAAGASHFHANPRRDAMHTSARQAEQLALIGIEPVPPPDLSFLTADVTGFGLAPVYLLLVPGGSAHRPEKRWPVDKFAKLATLAVAQGVQPVLLGAASEAPLTGSIAEMAPGSIDLAGRTGFGELAELARHARAAVGNDTGPMHLIAAAGCPAVVLFSRASDPSLCAPVGREVSVLRRQTLDNLPVEEVWAALHL